MACNLRRGVWTSAAWKRWDGRKPHIDLGLVLLCFVGVIRRLMGVVALDQGKGEIKKDLLFFMGETWFGVTISLPLIRLMMPVIERHG